MLTVLGVTRSSLIKDHGLVLRALAMSWVALKHDRVPVRVFNLCYR